MRHGLYVSAESALRKQAAEPALRKQAKAARRCRHGYEYGHWMVHDKDDTRIFVRVGISRTLQMAMSKLDRL